MTEKPKRALLTRLKEESGAPVAHVIPRSRRWRGHFN